MNQSLLNKLKVAISEADLLSILLPFNILENMKIMMIKFWYLSYVLEFHIYLHFSCYWVKVLFYKLFYHICFI